MTYFTGSVTPVPAGSRQAYLDFSRKAWPHFQKRGASRMVETWSDEIQPGKQTDFLRAVAAKDGEAVAFAWIEWPDRATADAAWAEMMNDPQMGADMGEMPFDGKRMIFGGFQSLVTDGSDRGGGYYQGFLTPVPEGNKDAFETLAHAAWEEMFKPYGCLGNYESWGADVPRGTQTDMYRAVDAKDGEVVVMSWGCWPDRATCEEAGRRMEAAMEGKPMPDMPFDGKRMIWAGFETLFDSDRDGSRG
ncbi:DUF1428 domain-containing protein [Paracoccus sp. Z118]|uniref:DUF1428 domain-containing protein n=1 Tax=Paracoccus sp. Z118 TaxID=2851017 RepID=UPI001C2C2193|nr:DUF1428 domain-containing protein [Paracoccus sp. Z118]MBV0891876.1 DUF1428 domain-containing protein [Paracoccus sp. Z118]